MTEDFLDYLGEIYEASKGFLKYQDGLDIEYCSFCTSNNRRFFDAESGNSLGSAIYGENRQCTDNMNALAVYNGKPYVTKQDVKGIILPDGWSEHCRDKITYAVFVNSELDS